MNTITAVFKSGFKAVKAPSLYQWDYGQVLILDGLELPEAYEVHFSNKPECGQAEVRIGTGAGVSIPDKLLESGEPLYAFVFLHTGEDDGETVYTVSIPVTKRPKPYHSKPTTVQQSVITEAIAALQTAVSETAEYRQDASDFADAAGSSAQIAEGYASDALDSANNASAYRDETIGYAEAAAQSSSDAFDYKEGAYAYMNSAYGHSEDAASAAVVASASADNAAQSERNAQLILDSIPSTVDAALASAKQSGEFDGAVFTPSISAAGIISWTNNGGLPNPEPVDMVSVICNALPLAQEATF